MPRPFLALAAALAIVGLAPSNRSFAQNSGLGADPFSLYYGYYLPHAAAIAAQPSPLDLSRRPLWQLVEEQDVPRNLERGQLALQELS